MATSLNAPFSFNAYPHKITPMPVHVARRGGKYRIVDHAGDIETTPQGHAKDGGGHKDKKTADAQARAINASLRDPNWRDK